MSTTRLINKHLIKNQYKFVIDVETTGFDPIRNDIISICLLAIDHNNSILGEHYSNIQPDFNQFYSDDAEKVHGISRKTASSFKSRRDGAIDILNFLKPFKSDLNASSELVFHAVGGFDWNFLQWLFIKEELHWSLRKVFDGNYLTSTIQMARLNGYKDNKLNQWASRLGFDLKHHDAKSDAHGCLNIYKFLLDKL